MIHNVLARQLPLDAGRVDGGARGRRHRPGPAAADPRGRGVAGAPRGARPDRARRTRPRGLTGPRRRATPRPADDPLRRLSPVVRLAPGQAQPDPRRRRPPAATATTRSTRSSCRSALADRLSLAPVGGRPRHPPRDRVSTPARRPTTSCCARSPRPARRSAAAGRAVPGRRRPSPPGSRSGSRSRPGWPAGRPTPRRRSTARSRRGARSSTTTRRHARRRAARLGRPVLPRRRPGARRGPRRARRAAPRAARRRPASCS